MKEKRDFNHYYLDDSGRKRKKGTMEIATEDNQGLVAIFGDGGIEFFYPLPTGREENKELLFSKKNVVSQSDNDLDD
ncbi:MAG TPA: hypothetical protein GX706_01650 [Candidatus Moranbacteria bacterium]|nr:hypothetical protein [Candidatus Moranbacteria bacterium]